MKRILIVGGDPFHRRTLGEFLKVNGYEVEKASDRSRALGQLKLFRMDLVIAQVSMTRMDALELLEHMSASGLFQAIPVLVLTSQLDPEVQERIQQAGAYALLPKDGDWDDLLAVIKGALGNH